MKKAFLITFELTERVIMDVENPNNLTEAEEGNICWVGREKIRQNFDEKFMLDNVSEIVEDTEVPFDPAFDNGGRKRISDYLKRYDTIFLCDFYNAYRDELCGIAEESIFNLRDYEDFHLLANAYGLDVAKKCQEGGMFWVAGSNYKEPLFVGDGTKELLSMIDKLVEDEYLVRESLRPFIRNEFFS